MRELKVRVKSDHLVRMTKVKKPILAIAELIWNSFDADADKVEVKIKENPLGGIELIQVADNGHGIEYNDVDEAFGNLGGSWKTSTGRSKNNRRILHGKAGKGRYRAFSLGEKVVWKTSYKTNGQLYEYAISGDLKNPGSFFLSPKKERDSGKPGTIVDVFNIHKNFRTLQGQEAVQEITELFALYLHEYPGLSLLYDRYKVDPSTIITCKTIYPLSPVISEDGVSFDASLTIIEWNTSADRSLYLCDKDGFSLDRDTPKIHAPGFNFTGYIKSDYIRELDDDNKLVLKDMNPELQKLMDDARDTLRNHFRKRQAELATNLVDSWKKEDLYPYDGDPKDFIEETERQIFDICALNINNYMPGFENIDNKNKKLSFALIKQALKENPKSLQKILFNVIELPQDKQDDLANLLEKTTLAAIVNASKTVADRLDFIKGLDSILFDPESKESLLERSQLQRILADHTWIFGEEFNLSIDDESLNAVLTKHLEILGKERIDLAPVVRVDGSSGIVDLMLSRVIPQPKANEQEHLVVELKRPKQSIGPKEQNQIESYAFAVSGDERFRDTNTTWHFIAVSNEITEDVRKKTRQKNRPPGLLYEDQDNKLFVWVKSWGQILEDARARLTFFQEKLQYSATLVSGLEYLKKTHEKYLPKNIVCS